MTTDDFPRDTEADDLSEAPVIRLTTNDYRATTLEASVSKAVTLTTQEI